MNFPKTDSSTVNGNFTTHTHSLMHTCTHGESTVSVSTEENVDNFFLKSDPAAEEGRGFKQTGLTDD